MFKNLTKLAVAYINGNPISLDNVLHFKPTALIWIVAQLSEIVLGPDKGFWVNSKEHSLPS